MSDDSSDVRDLLRSVADVPPPVRIDVAAVLAEADHAVRRRRVGRAVAGVAACAAVVGTFTAVPLLRPDHPGTRVGAPAPATHSRPPATTGPSTPPTGPPGPVQSDGSSGIARMTIALGQVLPLPAADLTQVDGRAPMVFYPSDTAYTAVADIRDRDGIGSISVRVEPMNSQASTNPCYGQMNICERIVRSDATLGLVDTQVGRDGHRWKVIAVRKDNTFVVVEGMNWSEEERRTTGAAPFAIVGRVDAPLTTNQMIRVATAKDLYWG